ncbi:MAG: hemin receptor [Candidatus Kuenenia stuttgartiensis]|uniref:Globin domain-containing protein n=1 Tax=Kuenenia stuttgartiensis TaxID=174633 RepID=A0A2C9CE97_KUEST|nr:MULTISPECIES: globin family protein [Kuenenia]MBW7941348.1 hemin receptor [Candidatus Kuenenia stuttgartiensis]MBZ0190873.1 hypothetical protein [Candidatus Kuenenia stuttgartiensis]MCL4726205.1 hypothetical protein [Candidatus Kuenenia stuttgartiensis]MCZ7621830.1 globin domain-containing protein [Candidatus Kuenenia sp.]SOH04209.1 hypothetical protein KSMBR1_1710 [Candidatus Kuenenia stuttgartiensis]
MRPEQIELVRKTFAKIQPVSYKAAEMFYRHLFETDPSLRQLFKRDIKKQGRMLMQMIDFAVKGLDDPEIILPAIQALGKRHVGYGVKEEHYETVGNALLWTLEQGLGDAFTLEVKEAWSEAYKLLAGVMIEAASGSKCT